MLLLQLRNSLNPLLDKKSVRKVFEEVENPLVKVLADMEFEGIRVDMDFLKEYSKELEREAATAESNVYREAGVKFNLSSPKQLGEVLFEKLKLDPKAKKTKTGQYQTGEDVLLKLAAKGEKIADDILVFREMTKLKSTYVDSLPTLINKKTGRVLVRILILPCYRCIRMPAFEFTCNSERKKNSLGTHSFFVSKPSGSDISMRFSSMSTLRSQALAKGMRSSSLPVED